MPIENKVKTKHFAVVTEYITKTAILDKKDTNVVKNFDKVYQYVIKKKNPWYNECFIVRNLQNDLTDFVTQLSINKTYKPAVDECLKNDNTNTDAMVSQLEALLEKLKEDAIDNVLITNWSL